MEYHNYPLLKKEVSYDFNDVVLYCNPLTVRKWKAEQDKCFDNPDTGQFHSNISQL